MTILASVIPEIRLGPWNLKWITWRDHAHFRDSLSSVGWDLLWSIGIPNLKCLHYPRQRYERQHKRLKNLVLSHPLGNLGVTHRIHLWLDEKRTVDFLLVLIEHFPLALTAEALWALLVEISLCSKRGVTFSTNFRGNGASPTNNWWRQKTTVRGLSRGVDCVILCLAILTQYCRMIDGRTDRRTHNDSKYRASSGKNHTSKYSIQISYDGNALSTSGFTDRQTNKKTNRQTRCLFFQTISQRLTQL